MHFSEAPKWSFQVMPAWLFGNWEAAEFVTTAEEDQWFHRQAAFFRARRQQKGSAGTKQRRAPGAGEGKREVKERRSALAAFRGVDNALLQIRGEGLSAFTAAANLLEIRSSSVSSLRGSNLPSRTSKFKPQI